MSPAVQVFSRCLRKVKCKVKNIIFFSVKPLTQEGLTSTNLDPGSNTEKMADTANVGHHQNVTGLNGTNRFSGYNFIINGKQSPGDAGKKCSQCIL